VDSGFRRNDGEEAAKGSERKLTADYRCCVDSGFRRNDGRDSFSHAWERVRSDEVETLDVVGGEGGGSLLVNQVTPDLFAWNP
jgi:hypothetical protein